MSLASQSDRQLLIAWQQGNQQAADLLVRRYRIRLIALARSRLSRRLATRTDPEEIVMSAWRSFFVAANDGLSATTDDLWPLLATLTMRKLARHAEYHLAARRDVDVEWSFEWHHRSLVSREPKPDEAGSLLDEVELLLKSLDESERQIVTLSLQGYTHKEIAQRLDCSDRTIRRAFADVKARLAGPRSDESMREPPKLDPVGEPTSAPILYSDLQLLTLIGQGRFGKVYRAMYSPEGRIIAVKFLRKAFWQETEAVTSLFREAHLVSQLSHPNVVEHLGWGRTPHGAVYLVMEWIDGPDLAHSGRVPMLLPDATNCVRQIGSALIAAHQAGIVHGDLTPSNVLCSEGGRYVLTDFGFARSTIYAAPTHLGGTPGFLAPEQLSDAFGTITPATDVYALAGLFVYMLSGHPPVAGDSIIEMMTGLISTNPSKIPIHLAIPDRLRELLETCLSKASSDRPNSVGDFLSALEKCD